MLLNEIAGLRNSLTGSSIADMNQRAQFARIEERLRAIEERLQNQQAEPPEEKNPVLSQAEEDALTQARFAKLETKFLTESRDSTWAVSTEKRISDVLAEPQYAGSRIIDLACKKDMCRMKIGHDTREAELRWQMTFAEQVPELPAGAIEEVDDGNGGKGSIAYFGPAEMLSGPTAASNLP